MPKIERRPSVLPPSAWNSPPLPGRFWIAAALLVLLVPAMATSVAAEEPLSEAKASPSPTQSASQEAGGGGASKVGDQVIDAVVLRPLGALSLVGGAVFFVVTSPLVLVSRVIDYSTSWDVMVMAPWEYTVERPLGDL